MEKELPKGWETEKLEFLLDRITNGCSLDQHNEQLNGRLPITRIETIADGIVNLERVKYIDFPGDDVIEKYKLHIGDILFSHINSDKHLGKTAYFDIENEVVIHGINLLLLRPSKKVQGKYLHYILQGFRNQGKFIEVAQRAVNQSSINQKKLKTFDIPLPPLPEQHRIVAKLDAVLAKVDSARGHMERLPGILQRFRQSVLAQAVSGKLTEGWRRENAGVESAEELFLKINNLRNSNYFDELETSKQLKRGKPRLPTNLESKMKIDSDLEKFMLKVPSSWTYLPLGRITKNEANSIVDGPFGSSINVKEDYIEHGGIPVVRINNVRPFQFVNENLKFVKEEKFTQLKRHNILPGDILLAKVGATIGDCCIYPSGLSEALLSTTGSCRIRVDESIYDNYFLNIVLSFYKPVFQQIASTVAQPFLNMVTVKNFPVPFLTLAEQQEIVRRVRSLFAVADRLEARYEALREKVEGLPQALLAKAFRGELVGR